MAFSIPTYELHVRPNHTHGSDNPTANQNACWVLHTSPTTALDTSGHGPHRRVRTADSFEWWVAFEFKIDSSWTSAGQGNFGTMTTNWKTVSGDVIPNSGAFLVSPFYMSYREGKLWVQLEPNSPNHEFSFAPNLSKGVWHSLLFNIVLGRTDGSTPQPGRVRVWLDGADTPLMDTGSVNSLWRDSQGDVQTFMDIMEGFYTAFCSQELIASFTAARFGKTLSECLGDSAIAFGTDAVGTIYRGSGLNLGPSSYSFIASRQDTNFLLPSQFGGVPAPPPPGPGGNYIGPWDAPIQWNSVTAAPPTAVEQMTGPWGNSIEWNSTAAPLAGSGAAGRFLKRFHGPALLSDVADDLYTVPSGRRAVIRNIHVSNPGPLSVDFTLSIGTDAAATRLWDGYPIAADGLLQHYNDHTLVAGEKIQAYADSYNILNLTITGYEENLVGDVVDSGSYGQSTYGSGTYGGN